MHPQYHTALEAARARQQNLLKIPGSLGLLEETGNRIAALQNTDRPVLGKGAVIVCCGDHDVVTESVAPYPQGITRLQTLNFLHGHAAINQIAAANNAEVWVVDAAVLGDAFPAHERLVGQRIRQAAGNIVREAAMTHDQTLAAIELGREAVRRAVASGATLLAAGDMGIGNTTPAAALTAAWLGLDAVQVTGRGSGLDDVQLAHKVAMVRAAVERAQSVLGDLQKADPLDVLAHLGGPDFAAMAGVYLEGAKLSIPMVADGFPVTAGVLAAVRLDPQVRLALFAGHQSVEPGHGFLLRELGLEPFFRIGLRLGEGTGAVLAFGALRSAAQVLSGMITFADAGIPLP